MFRASIRRRLVCKVVRVKRRLGGFVFLCFDFQGQDYGECHLCRRIYGLFIGRNCHGAGIKGATFWRLIKPILERLHTHRTRLFIISVLLYHLFTP